jgi:hypothetical protein
MKNYLPTLNCLLWTVSNLWLYLVYGHTISLVGFVVCGILGCICYHLDREHIKLDKQIKELDDQISAYVCDSD